MSYLDALRISASGLSAQRTRVDLAASNLANAETTRGPDGTFWKRLDPVLEAVPAGASGGAGVQVAEIVQDTGPGRRIFSPEHPDADPDGFVVLPDVDPVHETVNLISASRSFEANASALETLKSMAMRAIDILR